jgi:hypothetical protein
MLLKHLVQNLGSCSGQQLLHLVVTENDLEFPYDRSKNGEIQDWHMKKHITERLFLEDDAMVSLSLSLSHYHIWFDLPLEFLNRFLFIVDILLPFWNFAMLWCKFSIQAMAFTFDSAIHCVEYRLGRLHEEDLLHQAVSEHKSLFHSKNSSFGAPANNVAWKEKGCYPSDPTLSLYMQHP